MINFAASVFASFPEMEGGLIFFILEDGITDAGSVFILCPMGVSILNDTGFTLSICFFF